MYETLKRNTLRQTAENAREFLIWCHVANLKRKSYIQNKKIQHFLLVKITKQTVL